MVSKFAFKCNLRLYNTESGVRKIYMHIISDDLTHDQESVHVFHTAVWKELNKMGVR